MLSSDHKQKLGVEARGAKIQQMYENVELDLDLKLSFMVTGHIIKVVYELIPHLHDTDAACDQRAFRSGETAGMTSCQKEVLKVLCKRTKSFTVEC